MGLYFFDIELNEKHQWPNGDDTAPFINVFLLKMPNNRLLLILLPEFVIFSYVLPYLCPGQFSNVIN